MNHAGLQIHPPAFDPRVNFAARPPSPTWERVAPPDAPQNYVWVWYKPPHVPQGLILRIPDEIYSTSPQLAAQWTLRRLLHVAGITADCVATWHMHGVAYDAMHGMSPFLDAAIPAPVAGIDPQIVVIVQVPVMMPMAPMMVAPAPVMVAPQAPMPAALQSNGSAPASLLEYYEAIETDWAASLEIERELVRLRKQLVDMMGRLKSLNRELHPPERLYSSNQDKKDWVDARRWLRDSSTKCWKCIKDHDIGDTSAAGQRKWFEETYQDVIVPRRQFDGIQQAHRNYEGYRKLVQTLHITMCNTLSNAANDGERRAQAVLTRIAAKVRDATNRKNFLGVIMDS